MTPSSGVPGFFGRALALRSDWRRGNGIDPSVEYTRRRSSFGILFSEIGRDVEEEISLGLGRRTNSVEDVVAAPAVRRQRLAFRFPARILIARMKSEIDVFPANAGRLIGLCVQDRSDESLSARLTDRR